MIEIIDNNAKFFKRHIYSQLSDLFERRRKTITPALQVILARWYYIGEEQEIHINNIIYRKRNQS